MANGNVNVPKDNPLFEFCWGMLFHLLCMHDRKDWDLKLADKIPWPPDASRCAGEPQKTPFVVLREQILLCEKISVNEVLLDQETLKVNDTYKEIILQVSNILTQFPGRPNTFLANEPLHPPSSQDSELADGYSRHPFQRCTEDESTYLALGAVCYMFRAKAQMLLDLTKPDRFSKAKRALNDLHQAYQLTWRLYHSLGSEHHHAPGQSLYEYLSEVAKAVKALPMEAEEAAQFAQKVPGSDAYFVWTLFLLSEILRGNVYKEIDHFEAAERHYRRAQHRFEELERSGKAEDLDHHPALATPTLVNALFERSKLAFDTGHLLESLQLQLWCLEYLLRVSAPHDTSVGNHITVLRTIQQFLIAERTLPILDRARITYCFGDELAVPVETWKKTDSGQESSVKDNSWEPSNINTVPRLPEAMVDVRGSREAHFAAEILARVGFTLYVLRPNKRDERSETILSQRKDWLRGFFAFDVLWNKNENVKKIRASYLGRYCQTLFDTGPDTEPISDQMDFFRGQLERRFMHLLRQVSETPNKNRTYGDREFYLQILETTTQNIRNLGTIPRRNHRVLMRRGYCHRRTEGDLSFGADSTKTGALDKLVVLRRWQSYNPKIPRLGSLRARGGGYFLMWHNRGIVIDPGYDFIQNFYDEGFSLEDIDAVMITHSHPDHDDDFSSLMALVREWNEYHEMIGQSERVRKLDLFLNESTHKKFSSWLQALSVKFGRIIPLPVLCWDKETKHWSAGPMRGENPRLVLHEKITKVPDCFDGNPAKATAPDAEMSGGELPVVTSSSENKKLPKHEFYDMEIEIVPAWHDDVIGKTSAVGLKIHLFEGQDEVGVIGFSGDTGAYGLDFLHPKKELFSCSIEKQYADCDVLVAHLGDIRLRELMSLIQTKDPTWPKHPASTVLEQLKRQCEGESLKDCSEWTMLRNIIQNIPQEHPLLTLFREWFREFVNDDAKTAATHEVFVEKVSNFLRFAITLQLIPSEALSLHVPRTHKDQDSISIQDWLGQYIDRQRHISEETVDQVDLAEVFAGKHLPAPTEKVPALTEKVPAPTEKEPRDIEREIADKMNIELLKAKMAMGKLKFPQPDNIEECDRHAYFLLEFLCVRAMWPWQYEYHLGIYGIYRLYQAMVKCATEKNKTGRLFIVGELPEELTSYRDKVAYWLNYTNDTTETGEPRHVCAFTGDIGMHVKLMFNDRKNKHNPGEIIQPKIRCAYCNMNNELIDQQQNYHVPGEMRETALKRMQGAMIYLCTARGHHGHEDTEFLCRPELRVV
jgi:hypothetical protein